MAFVATENFQRANEILEAPPPEIAKIVNATGADNTRWLLRHLVGEQNRSFFSSWELAQFGIGALLAAVLFLDSGNRRLAGFAAAMLVLTAFSHFILTPELIFLGRSIEFTAAGEAAVQRGHFQTLHVLYGVLEAVKILFGAALAGVLFAMRRRHLNHQDQMDLFDAAPLRGSGQHAPRT